MTKGDKKVGPKGVHPGWKKVGPAVPQGTEPIDQICKEDHKKRNVISILTDIYACDTIYDTISSGIFVRMLRDNRGDGHFMIISRPESTYVELRPSCFRIPAFIVNCSDPIMIFHNLAYMNMMLLTDIDPGRICLPCARFGVCYATVRHQNCDLEHARFFQYGSAYNQHMLQEHMSKFDRYCHPIESPQRQRDWDAAIEEMRLKEKMEL